MILFKRQHTIETPPAWSHRAVRALILATACWVLSTPLTTVAGSAAAFVGAFAACFWVDSMLSRSRLWAVRTPIILLSCVIAVVIAHLIANALTSSAALARVSGAITVYQSGQILFWLVLAAASGLGLRLLAHRYSWGSVPELVFVASAFVITLAAHQRGMIDRPYFIGDFALIRGIDPSALLMGIGVVAVMALTILLMIEQQQRRLPYHFSILALLCFSLLFYVQFFGMPTPRLTDDLGLTGQSMRPGGATDENPFRDGENDASDREAPVAIVLFRDDYEPAEGAYYFRESAYSQFNGSYLWTAERNDMDNDLVHDFPVSPITVTEEIPATHLRRSVTTTIGLLTPHRGPFALDAPLHFESTPNPNSLRFRQTYTVESLVPEFQFPDLIGRQAGSPNWTVAQWQEYLTLPDDPRYGELARELTQGLRQEFAEDPYARALAIKAWFDDNGIYSLANDHAYANDPAASFLFGDLTGYCIHFSYAATYLYRSLGIPARVAVGYSVPSANRAGGSALLIQAVNGHAWPEIYLDGLGWVIVDPAPRQSLVDMSVEPQDSLQQLLGDMLRDDPSFDAFVRSQQGASVLTLDAVVRSAALLALVLLLAGYIIRGWRALSPSLLGNSLQYRLQFRAALDQLAAYGIRRRSGESREAFARRVSSTLPAVQTLSDWHLQWTPGYGLPAPGSESVLAQSVPVPATAWQAQRRALRHQLRASQPAWRRVWAWLHPVPWLYSR